MATKARRAAAAQRKTAARAKRRLAKPVGRARLSARRRPAAKARASLWANLKPGPANFAPLTPISFLPRSAEIHPDRIAVVHGRRRFTYSELYARARRLASALEKRGIGKGDTVSAMLPNVPAMIEAHFGVPMLGAVLNTINTRLDADTVHYILEHGEAKAIITDRAFAAAVGPALKQSKRKLLVIDNDDPLYTGPGERLGEIEYEAFLAQGDPAFAWSPPADESAPIALNYTSGTTGRPKGVVYHHRGTFLETVGNIMAWPLPPQPVYLWTLPLFHCNGWCFGWSVVAMGGTQVCLRQVDPALVFPMIVEHGVTHMCGAPTVLSMLINAPADQQQRFAQVVDIQTGGSPPPAKVIKSMEELGFRVTHIYGMTELQGPSTLCEPQSAWQRMPIEERAVRMARQGVRYPVVEGHIVGDPKTCRPVPRDGIAVGEILVKGNTVMLGYLKDAKRDGGSVRRRLDAHRRPRGLVLRPLRRGQGSQEGHHHLRRREHLERRSGDRALPARRCRARRGRGAPRREMGRDAVRVRAAQAGCERDRGGDDPALPREPGPVQDPAEDRVRRAADHRDREDPEVRAAGAGARALKREPPPRAKSQASRVTTRD